MSYSTVIPRSYGNVSRPPAPAPVATPPPTPASVAVRTPALAPTPAGPRVAVPAAALAPITISTPTPSPALAPAVTAALSSPPRVIGIGLNSVLEDEELQTRIILEPATPRITEDLEPAVCQNERNDPPNPELKVPVMEDHGADYLLLPPAPTLAPNRLAEVILVHEPDLAEPYSTNIPVPPDDSLKVQQMDNMEWMDSVWDLS
ncbi:hypothetical protein BDD12DRAFT_903220 [Trichophaea hybrida]|nr:hypothetical protein BDD12DRAFT_903220 [Trichophaea hybrida]